MDGMCVRNIKKIYSKSESGSLKGSDSSRAYFNDTKQILKKQNMNVALSCKNENQQFLIINGVHCANYIW
jgi:hypothetical protein